MVIIDPAVPRRDQLKAVFKTDDLVKKFEKLFKQGGTLLPTDVAALYILAQENNVDAGIADAKAVDALSSIELLKKHVDEVDISTSVRASQALDSIALLRKYVEEVDIESGTASTQAIEALDRIESTINQLEETSILAGNADAKANQALALISDLMKRNQQVVSITANYTAMVGNYSILADATGGAITVTLPLASTAESFIIGVTKLDASTNTVTITRSGADLIIGEISHTLSYQAEVINVISDGSNWQLVS